MKPLLYHPKFKCTNCGKDSPHMMSGGFGHEHMVCSERCGKQLYLRIRIGKRPDLNMIGTNSKDELTIRMHCRNWWDKDPFAYKTVSVSKIMLRTQIKLLKHRAKYTNV